jgi:hypothetical protein
MIDEPSDDEAKELYAHFGLAFYCSNVLEHGVANALCVLELLEERAGAGTREEWQDLVDKNFEGSFEKTLGRLRTQLAQHQQRLPALANVTADINKCLVERNFMTHHFWRECATHWFTRKGRASMVQRLEKARDLFSETDRRLDAAIQPFADRFGLTAEIQRYELELIKREAQEDPS